MVQIGLAGDWHGNTRWAVSVLDEFHARGIDIVYQLGDFGIWPGEEGAAYLGAVIDVVRENKQTLWITPGNHEDYTQIDNIEGEKQVLAEGDGWEVALLPRGFYWEVDGISFVSLGGAPSIDYPNRVRGKDWWPEEAIREEDLDRLVKTADVMLAHDAPDGCTPLVQSIIDTPWWQSGWSEAGLRYAHEGRRMMNRAVEKVQPKVFAHGHFHVADYDEDRVTGQRYLSLGPDGEDSNCAILDTDDLKKIFASEKKNDND